MHGCGSRTARGLLGTRWAHGKCGAEEGCAETLDGQAGPEPVKPGAALGTNDKAGAALCRVRREKAGLFEEEDDAGKVGAQWEERAPNPRWMEPLTRLQAAVGWPSRGSRTGPCGRCSVVGRRGSEPINSASHTPLGINNSSLILAETL